MGNLPSDKKRFIFLVLNSTDLHDNKGNFLRKKEWLNPTQIQNELKRIGFGTVGRDEITSFLNQCNEHEKKFVDRRKPSRKDPDSETKAQNEYRLLDSGKELLEIMKSDVVDFINKRIKE